MYWGIAFLSEYPKCVVIVFEIYPVFVSWLVLKFRTELHVCHSVVLLDIG